jgi:hypothetical protein
MRRSSISLIALILLLTPCEARSEEDKWFTTIYYGIHSRTALDRTLEFRAPVDSNSFVGLGVGRELIRWKYASLEVEDRFEEHFGSYGRYQEYIAVLSLRYHYFPWDKYLKTTLAVSDGPSYATKQIEGENRDLMNLLGLELTLACPRYDWLSVVLGIEHRSGAKSTLHIANGDSNFYIFGLRGSF